MAKPELILGRATTRRAALGLGAAMAAGPPGTARAGTGAAAWPSRPVRYIEVIGPGSSSDLASRAWCQAMSGITGQPFVVESRGGAGGTVGNVAIARSTPDGYTIGMSGLGQLAVAPTLYPNLPYDSARDFTFVSGLLRTPVVLAVGNDLPARSVPELIELLRRQPGRYLYGHGGSGTSGHLAAELFRSRAGVELGGASYRGPTPALLDLAAGRVAMVATLLANVLPGLRDGRYRGLAVTSPMRSPALPDVPTLAETLPGFDLTSWLVVVGPAGIPSALAERMHHTALRALDEEPLRRQFEAEGSSPWRITAAQFAAYRAEQEAQLAPIIRASGARAE